MSHRHWHGGCAFFDDLKKALANRAMNAEMDHHLAGEEEAENVRILTMNGDSYRRTQSTAPAATIGKG
jgi:transposase-like protein